MAPVGRISGSEGRLIFAPRNGGHLGWHSRGYLPHLDQAGLVQSITFRLADSLPRTAVSRLSVARTAEVRDASEARRRVEAMLDSGHGECLLRHGGVAEIVQSALLSFDGERYRLLAWCIMPNHVHVLIEAHSGWSTSRVIQSWKSFSAKAANAVLGRTGAFWQRDYFDRFIRSLEHFRTALSYIESNPVSAGLVRRKEDWFWSSARMRVATEFSG